MRKPRRICGCAVGTIKSRVNRARNRLAEILSVEGSEDFGPDQETHAIIGSAVFGWRSETLSAVDRFSADQPSPVF